MLSLLLAPAAFGATMAGGLVALRLKDRLHLILGFSAGAVVGVAFFDLLPEAIRLADGIRSASAAMFLTACGFLFYLLLDRVALLHAGGAVHEHDHAAGHGHDHGPQRGLLGAVTLVAHSVFDGMAIGFGFQLSSAVGAAIAIAVLTHDFSDGINTMNVVLKSGGTRADGLRWLLADSLAPAIGIVIATFIHLPQALFGAVLAVFAGLFLYLGASDLVPESHHAHPKFLTTAMTILGAALVYATTAVVG